MRILVVDDDSAFRQLLQEELSFAGHNVLEATDGQQAWDILQRHSVQLVITDWMMPNLDGLELIRRIRAADLPRYTYIILLTARSKQEDVIAGLEVGADDYLIKPFDVQELHARVAIGERILALETRLRRAMNRLRVMATHDNLTGLLNRQAITKYAEVELARARRLKRPLCLVLLDIDYFKSVNDQYGHLIGDQALQLIAEKLDSTIRHYDRAGRWGGEEFMIVLPETTLEQAIPIAERVRECVARSRLSLPDGNSLSLSVSLGVTEAKVGETLSLEALIQQADEALYNAKNEGRDRVRTLA